MTILIGPLTKLKHSSNRGHKCCCHFKSCLTITGWWFLLWVPSQLSFWCHITYLFVHKGKYIFKNHIKRHHINTGDILQSTLSLCPVYDRDNVVLPICLSHELLYVCLRVDCRVFTIKAFGDKKTTPSARSMRLFYLVVTQLSSSPVSRHCSLFPLDLSFDRCLDNAESTRMWELLQHVRIES